jgi:hypothetical protein
VGPLQTTKLLRDEYGFEAFYSFAITPWALLTPDIQIIRGTQKDKVTIGQGPLGLLSSLNRKSIGTGTILGLRLQLVF